MDYLEPEQIFEGYMNGEIDHSSAMGYFISIIEISSDDQLRIDALGFLSKIYPRNNVLFEFLENLLISDDNNIIKAHAAKFMVNTFPHKAHEPIKWALENFEWDILDDNKDIGLCSILNDLRTKNDPKLNSLLDLKEHVVYNNKVFLVHDERLKLNNLNIKDINVIEGLEKLTNLKELDLSHNNINKIEGLECLTSLKKLDLSHNRISKIEGLASLSSLQQLYLQDNLITNIDGLDALVDLKYLNLDSNQIRTIENLNHALELNTLYLSSNKIKEIENLWALKNLFFLALNKNQINEIKGLENLINLRILRLSENEITDIKGLDNLKKLTTLNLSFNKISEAKDPDLPHLYFFSLDRNNIARDRLISFYKQHRVFRYFHYF